MPLLPFDFYTYVYQRKLTMFLFYDKMQTTFLAGMRNCIGQRFALLEEKLVIASIVKKFDMVSDTMAEDFAVYGQIVLQPVKKFHIKFIKRK